MIRIDTEFSNGVVEIDGEEYEVAPRTIEVCDRLTDIEKKTPAVPGYKLWMAELEVLLGKSAMRKIFPHGSKESVDRIQAVFAGVAKAFNGNSDAIEAEAAADEAMKNAPAIEQMEKLNKAIENLNRLMRAADGAQSDGPRAIPRPETRR